MAASVCQMPAKTEKLMVRKGTLALDVADGDGRILRLKGIRPPYGSGDWSELDVMARYAPAGWIEGQGVLAEIETGDRDRWGRRLARLWLVNRKPGESPKAVASGLLASGWALADPLTIGSECRKFYLVQEQRARTSKDGLWSNPWYTPLDVLNIAGLNLRAGETVIAKGQVRDVRRWKSLIFINFSKKRGKGLGLMLTRRAQRTFAAAGIKPDSLKLRKLRVRGLLEPARRPGLAPRIRLSGPEAIEFLR